MHITSYDIVSYHTTYRISHHITYRVIMLQSVCLWYTNQTHTTRACPVLFTQLSSLRRTLQSASASIPWGTALFIVMSVDLFLIQLFQIALQYQLKWYFHLPVLAWLEAETWILPSRHFFSATMNSLTLSLLQIVRISWGCHDFKIQEDETRSLSFSFLTSLSTVLQTCNMTRIDGLRARNRVPFGHAYFPSLPTWASPRLSQMKLTSVGRWLCPTSRIAAPLAAVRHGASFYVRWAILGRCRDLEMLTSLASSTCAKMVETF